MEVKKKKKKTALALYSPTLKQRKYPSRVNKINKLYVRRAMAQAKV